MKVRIRISRLILLSLIPIMFLSSCVSKKEYDKIMLENQEIRDELDKANKVASEYEVKISDVEKEIQRLQRLKNQLENTNQSLIQTNQTLIQTSEELMMSNRLLANMYSESVSNMISNLQAEVEKGKIEIKEMKGKLTVTVADEIFFKSGEAEIRDSAKDVLNRIGDLLKEYPDKAIRIEGHTDNRKIGPALTNEYASNWELAAARSINVTRYLIDEEDLDPYRFSAVSYAQYRPIASNRDWKGRAKNRRIEIILTDPELDQLNKKRAQFNQ